MVSEGLYPLSQYGLSKRLYALWHWTLTLWHLQLLLLLFSEGWFSNVTRHVRSLWCGRWRYPLMPWALTFSPHALMGCHLLESWLAQWFALDRWKVAKILLYTIEVRSLEAKRCFAWASSNSHSWNDPSENAAAMMWEVKVTWWGHMEHSLQWTIMAEPLATASIDCQSRAWVFGHPAQPNFRKTTPVWYLMATPG